LARLADRLTDESPVHSHTLRVAIDVGHAAAVKLRSAPVADRHGGCTVAAALLNLASDGLRRNSEDVVTIQEFPDLDPYDDPRQLVADLADLVAAAQLALPRTPDTCLRSRSAVAQHLAAAQRMLRLEAVGRRPDRGGVSRVGLADDAQSVEDSTSCQENRRLTPTLVRVQHLPPVSKGALPRPGCRGRTVGCSRSSRLRGLDPREGSPLPAGTLQVSSVPQMRVLLWDSSGFSGPICGLCAVS